MLELNQMYHMDCMEGMARFPDKYFDLAIVDPPYGLKEHGGRNRSKHVKQKNGNRIFVDGNKYKKKEWDDSPPSLEYFTELLRISRNQIIFGINYFDIIPAGKGRIIWDKCNDGSDQCGAEIAYNSANDRVDIFRFMWRGMLQGKSEFEGTTQQGNKKLNERRIHPTQKPAALYRWLIRSYTAPTDKLIFTHGGSASDVIAAEQLGRHYVWFENDEEYFKSAVERVNEFKSQIRFEVPEQ